MAKLITLKAWLYLTFGEDQPSVNTVRGWIKSQRIVPAPKKLGRTYYFTPDAQYRTPGEPAESLLDRIRRAA